MTIATFGKPLFVNMHHSVYAAAGAPRKPKVAYQHPDVSTGMARNSIDVEFALL